MANPAFMSIQGVTQGNITAGAGTEESVGNMAISDHPDESRLEQVTANMFIPMNPSSGSPVGQRVYDPIKVTKLFDKSSPLLRNALTTSEVLSEVVLSFYRQSATGTLEKFMTTTLTQAQVVGIEMTLPDVLDPERDQYGLMEDISLSFATINIDHIPAGTSSQDTFREVGV